MVEPSEQEPKSKQAEENKTQEKSYDSVTIQLAFQGTFVPQPYLQGTPEELKSKKSATGKKKRKDIKQVIEAASQSTGVEKVIPDGEDIIDSDEWSDKEEPIQEKIDAKGSFKAKRNSSLNPKSFVRMSTTNQVFE